MKAVVQRVKHAGVTVENKVAGSIGTGFLIFLGVEKEDDEKEVEVLADKIAGLRIFSDLNGKMNLSLTDIDGEVLVISNFTLCGNCIKGKRPFFGNAAPPNKADALYEQFCRRVEVQINKPIAQGIFGADMQVTLQNDGPVTMIIDSKELKHT